MHVVYQLLNTNSTVGVLLNRPHSYLWCWNGTSFQWWLERGSIALKEGVMSVSFEKMDSPHY